MPALKLLCACCLFVAASATACVGNASCAAEQDAAALLQSSVLIHDQEDKAAVERTCPETKELCDAERDDWGADTCTWQLVLNPTTGTTEGKCLTGCSLSTTQSSCPTYCMWRFSTTPDDGVEISAATYAAGWRCRDNYGSVDIGGASSAMVHYGKTASRPEFKTTERLNSAGTWEACGGEVDCWFGTGQDALRIQLGSSSTYSSASVELAIKCEVSTNVHIRNRINDRNARKNSNFQVFYNLREVPAWKSLWNVVSWNSELYELPAVPVANTDAYPVLRLELSRWTDTKDSVFEVTVSVSYVKVAFDDCMDVKARHGQCLKVFANEAYGVLRASQIKQKNCLLETDTTDDGCDVWRNCLDADGKEMALRLIASTTALALLQGASSQTWAPPNCKLGSRETCIDPSRLDVESFDCTCFDFMLTSTAAQIREAFCGHPYVCCSWKESRCPPALLQVKNDDSHLQIEGTMSRRSQQNHSESEDVASLDESLSGKRSC